MKTTTKEDIDEEVELALIWWAINLLLFEPASRHKGLTSFRRLHEYP